MKKITSFIIALVVAVQVFAGEGIVVQQKYASTSVPNTDITVTWYITDGACKMKMELQDKNGKVISNFIPDAKSGALLTYAEGEAPAGQKQTYYSIPLSSIPVTVTAGAGRIKVVKTGETKTISGFVCEKIMVFAADSETEMWVTKDYQPSFYQFYKFFRNDYALLGLNEESIKGVPLQITTKDLSGNVLISATPVSAAKTELPESTFQVPSGYELATPAPKK